VAIVSILVVKNDDDEKAQAKARAEEQARSLAAEMEREHQRKLAEEKAQLAQEAAIAAAETMRKAVEDEKERQKAREEALEKARTQGVLGSLALQQGGAFASLTGTGDISSGFDDVDVYGGLLGNEPGEMHGGFGNFGPGGGTGSGTIGLGNYGTLGHDSGTGQGYGLGTGRGGMRGRATPAPTVRLSVTQMNGALDKAIVTRILRRNLGRVTYCYEKQLLVEPGLSGRLTLGFEIAEDGALASPHATGVNDEVASCVESALASVRFPRPSSGTVSATASVSMSPPAPPAPAAP
jgi:membrane protein involved in colicin uptake